jgi:UDP-2-acetamido-2,6-beta-L-arabino-hexul-4-ose reductase
VVATFSHQVSHGELPEIDKDVELKLIYVGELVSEILNTISEKKDELLYYVPHTSICKVSKILFLIKKYTKKSGKKPTFFHLLLVTSSGLHLFKNLLRS